MFSRYFGIILSVAFVLSMSFCTQCGSAESVSVSKADHFTFFDIGVGDTFDTALEKLKEKEFLCIVGKSISLY